MKLKSNVEHVSLLLCILTGCCFFLRASGDDFEEFREREDEILVNCVHDAAPRFGKRICDCGYRNEEYIVPKFDGSTTEIEIANCKSLRIRKGTFVDLYQLTKLTVINVENLVLDGNSLDFTRNDPTAQLKINLINNLIEELPTHLLSGYIAEVTFTRCRIGVLRPYSITNIRHQLGSLNVVESFINKIERHAFKRFDVSRITIDGSKFIAPIPSQSFYEIEVRDRFVINNSSFTELLPSAFVMKNVTNMIISNSEFENLAGESFTMQIRNSIRITGNYFNKLDDVAFRAITLDSSYYSRHSEKLVLLFHNNRINRLAGAKSLRFSEDFSLQVRRFYIAQSINCDEASSLEQSSLLVHYPDEIFFNSVGKEGVFKSFNDIRRVQCMEDNFWLYLVAGVTVAAVVLVLITLLISWYCIAQKKKQQRKLEIVMPEPRTYRETQIIMQIENHGLLKTDL